MQIKLAGVMISFSFSQKERKKAKKNRSSHISRRYIPQSRKSAEIFLAERAIGGALPF